MRYALIGCGRISTNHIKAALSNNLEIISICDIVPERMSELLAKHNMKNDTLIVKYTDYKKMLAEARPELVAIATESGLHAEIAIDCIARGVNVIIEKPMAMSIADANKIIDMAQKNHVKVCACHQNRFNLAVREVCGALEGGRFGKLSHGSVHVRWNRGREYYEQASWRGTWAQDGGALMNQCIHGIDLLRWLMGDEVIQVYAQTRQQFHSYLECEDIGMAVVTFANGAIGMIEGTTNVYPENLEETLYLFGEHGTIKLGGKSCNSIDEWTFDGEKDRDADIQKGFYEQTENVYGNGHTDLYADMIGAVRENRAPYIDAQAGKRALEMVLAIYKSAAEGIPVQLPLTKCATTDFRGLFD